MAEQPNTEVTQLIGTLRALDQWRTAEVDMEGRGVHRKPDGSWYMQVQYLVEIVVPDKENVERLMRLVDGLDVPPIEATPVTTGEALGLFDSDAGEP